MPKALSFILALLILLILTGAGCGESMTNRSTTLNDSYSPDQLRGEDSPATNTATTNTAPTNTTTNPGYPY